MNSSNPVERASPEAGPVSEGSPDASGVDAPSRQLGLSTVLLALMRRELWEQWLAPLLVLVVIVAGAIPSDLGLVSLQYTGITQFGDFTADERRALYSLGHWMLTVPMYLVTALVLSFYLTDCLFAERKDRSILFWRALPVSDLVTVVSKALLGLVLVPLGTYVLALVTDLLFSGIWHLKAYLGARSMLLMPWDAVAWVKVQGLMGIGLIYAILWYAPVGAYLLLVSAWAKRNAVLWATLPPILVPIAELLMFRSSYVSSLLYSRTLGILEAPVIHQALLHSRVYFGRIPVVSLPTLFDTLPLAGVFTNIDLWIGVAVAVVCILLAARIRRYRDDS
jgi:ABC-2 type transport system permease protein